MVSTMMLETFHPTEGQALMAHCDGSAYSWVPDHDPGVFVNDAEGRYCILRHCPDTRTAHAAMLAHHAEQRAQSFLFSILSDRVTAHPDEVGAIERQVGTTGLALANALQRISENPAYAAVAVHARSVRIRTEQLAEHLLRR